MILIFSFLFLVQLIRYTCILIPSMADFADLFIHLSELQFGRSCICYCKIISFVWYFRLHEIPSLCIQKRTLLYIDTSHQNESETEIGREYSTSFSVKNMDQFWWRKIPPHLLVGLFESAPSISNNVNHVHLQKHKSLTYNTHAISQ